MGKEMPKGGVHKGIVGPSPQNRNTWKVRKVASLQKGKGGHAGRPHCRHGRYVLLLPASRWENLNGPPPGKACAVEGINNNARAQT